MIGQGLIKDIGFFTKNFGIVNAYRFRVRPLIGRIFFHRSYVKLQNQAFLEFLSKDLEAIISKYKNKEVCSKPLASDSIIWVCWWQGEANMPPLVKQCYKLLLKNSNGHRVIFIDKNNYKDYVELPDYIINKVHESVITLTHLSDILRVSLLAKYGGLWIDATYWCTEPLNITGNVFYTLKQHNKVSEQVAKCRWMGACIGGDKSLFIFAFLRDCFYQYWKKNNALLDYFLLDFLLDIAYNRFPTFKSIIDNNPYRCPNLHIMKQIFNCSVDCKELTKLKKANYMFKLSWKESYNLYDNAGNSTYYNHFMSL